MICKHTFYYFLGNKKCPEIYILLYWVQRSMIKGQYPTMSFNPCLAGGLDQLLQLQLNQISIGDEQPAHCCISASLQCINVSLHHCITLSLHQCITAASLYHCSVSLHHCNASLYHYTTVSLHHCITASLHT